MIQLVMAIIVAAALAGLLAITVERVAYRPLRLRGAPKLVALITAIGMSFFLADAVRFVLSLFGNFNRPFPSYTPDFFGTQIKLTDTAQLSYKSITIIVVATLMLWLLTFIVNRTRTGRAIRAVAQDQGTSSLMGINVTSIITITFLIGGALGGVAGVLYTLQFGNASPFMGFLPGLKAFTAAVLGGIGNIPGAMLGGVVLGLVETFAATYLPILTNNLIGAEYKDIIAFSVLIIILIFKPSGLLGKAVSEKV
jgi:branched-chain amino acid transport system permease protein